MVLDVNLLEMVALLETPTGFALFHVDKDLCKGPKNLWSWFINDDVADNVIFLLEFVKVEDKSVAWKSDGPGFFLTRAIKKYCAESRPLIVGDVELRGVIKSNLNVKCFENEAVISELMWGLKNVLSNYVCQERRNITLEYRLPLSQGLKDCMSKYEVTIPAKAIDRTFIACASTLHRLDVLSAHYRKRLPEICEPFVSGIREIVNDDVSYAKVVAMILTPELVKDCNPFEGLSNDEVRKIQDAAANNARKELDDSKYRLIYDIACDIIKFPGIRTGLIETIKSLADERSGPQKRSQTEIVEGTSGQDGYRAGANANANGECVKKARVEGDGEAVR